jgi:hypothetical protein
MGAIYKLMIHAAGTQIEDLALAIGTYPAFDGLVCNVQTPAQTAALQAIVAARPTLQTWIYMSALEYPFSLTAGLTPHPSWDWIRGNVQFMANVAGSLTRARMIVAGPAVGCFFAYCHAPTQEFYEIVAWPLISNAIADAWAAQMLVLAAAIGPRCGVYTDQSWLRMFDWMTDTVTPVPCNVVPFQSGHGVTSETGPQLPGAAYAALDATYGGLNNWREWYTQQARFQSQVDAGTPATAWNLHNGENRYGHAVNADPGFATNRDPFEPVFIESVHTNMLLAPGFLATGLVTWNLHPLNVLGINYQGQPQYIQDAKDAWLARGGGWISMHGYGPMEPAQIAALEDLAAYVALLEAVPPPPPPPPTPPDSGPNGGNGGACMSLSFITLAQLRQYVPADSTLTDAELETMGALAESIVQRGSGRTLVPYTGSRIFNGEGTPLLDVRSPMVAVTAVEQRCCGDTWEDLLVDCLSISRSGMLLLIGNVVPAPFRRVGDWHGCGPGTISRQIACGVFPMGLANIRVTGTWQDSVSVPPLAVAAVGGLVRHAASCDDPVGLPHTPYKSESVGGDRTYVLREIDRQAGVDMTTGYPDVDSMIAKVRGLKTAQFRVF